MNSRPPTIATGQPWPSQAIMTGIFFQNHHALFQQWPDRRKPADGLIQGQRSVGRQTVARPAIPCSGQRRFGVSFRRSATDQSVADKLADGKAGLRKIRLCSPRPLRSSRLNSVLSLRPSALPRFRDRLYCDGRNACFLRPAYFAAGLAASQPPVLSHFAISSGHWPSCGSPSDMLVPCGPT